MHTNTSCTGMEESSDWSGALNWGSCTGAIKCGSCTGTMQLGSCTGAMRWGSCTGATDCGVWAGGLAWLSWTGAEESCSWTGALDWGARLNEWMSESEWVWESGEWVNEWVCVSEWIGLTLASGGPCTGDTVWGSWIEPLEWLSTLCSRSCACWWWSFVGCVCISN